jgi:hypothetical protein
MNNWVSDEFGLKIISFETQHFTFVFNNQKYSYSTLCYEGVAVRNPKK